MDLNHIIRFSIRKAGEVTDIDALMPSLGHVALEIVVLANGLCNCQSWRPAAHGTEREPIWPRSTHSASSSPSQQ